MSETNPLKKSVDAPTDKDCFVLSGGACAYVCQDGTRILAAGGVITSWKDKHLQELEELVESGGARKVKMSQLASAVEKPSSSSIIAK